MLLSSIKLNPAHPCLSFSCLPMPSLSFSFPFFSFSCLPFPFLFFFCLPAFPSLAFPFFLSLLFFLFSFLFSSFSFLFSLSSLNFCPQSLSPISFCLIFAKTEETKIAYGRRDAEEKTEVRRTEDRLHEPALAKPRLPGASDLSDHNVCGKTAATLR